MRKATAIPLEAQDFAGAFHVSALQEGGNHSAENARLQLGEQSLPKLFLAQPLFHWLALVEVLNQRHAPSDHRREDLGREVVAAVPVDQHLASLATEEIQRALQHLLRKCRAREQLPHCQAPITRL